MKFLLRRWPHRGEFGVNVMVRHMNSPDELQKARQVAALAANSEDASVWRWFSALMEERRVRWCLATDRWLVSVDHRHVATERTFDSAMRSAKESVDQWQASGSDRTRQTRRAA